MSNNKFLADSNTEARLKQITGKQLKLFRICVGLRQYEVASRIGIPATKLCEIEAGRREAPPDLVAQILETIKEARSAKE